MLSGGCGCNFPFPSAQSFSEDTFIVAYHGILLFLKHAQSKVIFFVTISSLLQEKMNGDSASVTSITERREVFIIITATCYTLMGMCLFL